MAQQNDQIFTFSEDIGNTKKKLILYLKKNGSTSLAKLATEFSLSKMGILKHINQLEEQGLIKRSNVKSNSGRGRPTLHISLDESSSDIFPKAYSNLSVHALQYIDKKLGAQGVMEVLEDRSKVLEQDHREKFMNKSMEEKVRILTEIRNGEGYMAENSSTKENYILEEYNCPIFDVVQAYGHACTAERKMFENLLDTKVETTHRVVANNNVCRFVIKKKNIRK